MYDSVTAYQRVISRSVFTMPIGESTPPTLDDRFENLIISPERVMHMLGRKRAGEITFDQSEQGDARRTLLNVERIAIENKRLQEKTEASYIEMVNHQLHEILLEEMATQLSQTSDVYSHLLSLPEDLGLLLDALSVRAASVSKLEPIAATMPWLYDELITTVNTPRFRRKDSRGRIIVVETLRTALSFLGIENLRLLIPWIVLKRAIPQITDPYPLIKQKLMPYSMGVALSAKHIGVLTGLEKSEAYILGMLSNLGRCAVTRLYFKLFDKVQLQLLQECQKDREQKRHEALLKINPSANHLIAMQQEFADKVSAAVITHMNFKRLRLSEPMSTCAMNLPTAPSTLSRVLHQARTYTQVRMLHQLKLVDLHEAKPLIAEQKYPLGALEKLKSVDIFTLPLIKHEEKH